MKRHELFIVISLSLGEAPDIAALRREGVTLTEYAESLLDELLTQCKPNDATDSPLDMDSIRVVRVYKEEIQEDDAPRA